MLGFFLHSTLFEYVLVILIFINLIAYLVSNNKIFIFLTSKNLILNYLYFSITSFARGISAGAKS